MPRRARTHRQLPARPSAPHEVVRETIAIIEPPSLISTTAPRNESQVMLCKRFGCHAHEDVSMSQIWKAGARHAHEDVSMAPGTNPTRGGVRRGVSKFLRQELSLSYGTSSSLRLQSFQQVDHLDGRQGGSAPLLPDLRPARLRACSTVSVVRTPKMTGTPVASPARMTPRRPGRPHGGSGRSLRGHASQADDRGVPRRSRPPCGRPVGSRTSRHRDQVEAAIGYAVPHERIVAARRGTRSPAR